MAARFHIVHARWERDREALRSIREEVFVHGQQVPVALEWDGLDEQCEHLLAMAGDGKPIGTARLTPQHDIGRMAVLADWRGQGVGAGLLAAALDLARARQWPEASLHAQESAIGFYARFGFVAEGDTFMEAGIRHQLMRLPLAEQADLVTCHGPGETTDFVQRLLAATRHQCCIASADLMPQTLDNEATILALRKITESSRHASIRCLLSDVAKLQRDGHRLLDLAQRLPSIVELRLPEAGDDLIDSRAFMLNDADGYLYWPDTQQALAKGRLHGGARQRMLLRDFNQAWERATPASALRQLSL